MNEPACNLSSLSAAELEALRGAAVWYAKYQASAIAAEALDASARAAAEREEYLALVNALAKLGVKLRVPEVLSTAADRAAA